MTLSKRGLQQAIEQAGTRPCEDHTCEITLEMFTQEFLQHPEEMLNERGLQQAIEQVVALARPDLLDGLLERRRVERRGIENSRRPPILSQAQVYEDACYEARLDAAMAHREIDGVVLAVKIKFPIVPTGSWFPGATRCKRASSRRARLFAKSSLGLRK